MMKPEIDKEFASLIPPLSAEEYMQLEANLVSEGCRDRLLVWGDILIDGHNRLQICTKHNIPYEVTALDFANRDEAKKYIILNQFGRRNLSLGNRSLLGLMLESLYKEKAKKNQQQSPGRGKKGSPQMANLFPKIDTREKIAEIAGVSHTTIDRVKHIVDHGTPEHIRRIKEGGKGNAVNTVYDEVRKLTAPPSVENSSEGSPSETAGAVFDEIRKTAAPPPIAPDESGGEDDALAETDGDADTDGQESPDDFSETDSEEDDLERIKGYVAELKNPDLDRSFTTEMFLAEYEAFAGRFIRSVEAFGYEPYRETYPLLSDAERGMMSALSAAMIKAIQKQNTYIRNENA